MIAFRLAYRLGTEELIVPTLLAPEQPDHDFKADGAFGCRFDFRGFIPRHVLPALIVQHFQDVAKIDGREIVWQNGVLLRPRRRDAEALVRADYHIRTIDFLINGRDGPSYLGTLRRSVLTSLETMPQLAFEEKIQLRPEMLVEATGRAQRDGPVWLAYEAVQAAQRNGDSTVYGPGGRYDLRRVLAALPVNPEERQVDVFFSYSNKDSEQAEKLVDDLRRQGISVWYDVALIAGQPHREVLRQRIESMQAVVVLWSENSIHSKWVQAEASFAYNSDKLICVYDSTIKPKDVPLPFSSTHHMFPVDATTELIATLQHFLLGSSRRA
jgi:hypothetical protein